MKALLIFALIAFCTLAAVRRPMSSTDISTLERIKSQNNWGSFMVALAETHIMTNGPVSELQDAIKNLIEDLNNKLEQANRDWDRRVARHEVNKIFSIIKQQKAEVRRLTDMITRAKQDIADTQQQLNEVLLPLRADLQQAIVNTNAALDKNARDNEEAISTRARRQKEYEDRQVGYSDAIAALNEAIEILTPLLNGGTALVEIKKAHRSIQVLTNKLKTHNPEMDIIKALAQLASSEFANTDAIQNVINKMDEMRNKFHLGKEQDTKNNDQEIVDHKVNLQQLSDQRADLTNTLNKKTEQLAQTEEQIEAAKQYIEQRTADQKNAEAALLDENTRFDADQRQYNDLVAEFNSELKACADALYVLENTTFEDYIGNRMQQDKVIDTAHGGPALPSQYSVPI